MRSSKSRSRNKSRNQRSLGNVVNRVFDSSGPEGKVRGTPQQIIEKYLALARDAQLSNDRVAEQSFLQHAEHYTRMLGEAQREQAERQAQFGGQPGDDRDDRPAGNGSNGGYANGNGQVNGHGTSVAGERRDDRRDDRGERRDDRRDDRGERRDDRAPQNERRDDRREARAPREERRDDRRDERAPRGGEADQPAQLSDDGDAPEFLRRTPRPSAEERPGIPEPLSVDADNGPVDTPETRDSAPPVPTLDEARAVPAPRGDADADTAEAPARRTRSTKPRAATGTTTVRRPRKRADDGSAPDAEPRDAEAPDVPAAAD